MPTSLPQRRRYVERDTLVVFDEMDAFFLIMLPMIAILLGVYLAIEPEKRAPFIDASLTIICADAATDCDDLNTPEPAPKVSAIKRSRDARGHMRPHLSGRPHPISG